MMDGFCFESVVFSWLPVKMRNSSFACISWSVSLFYVERFGYTIYSHSLKWLLMMTVLVYAVESKASSVLDLLVEQEIEFAFHDKIYPGLYAPIEEGTEVVIERTVPVMLTHPAVEATYYTSVATVKELLEELAVPQDGTYFITPLPDSPVVPGMEINLVRGE